MTKAAGIDAVARGGIDGEAGVLVHKRVKTEALEEAEQVARIPPGYPWGGWFKHRDPDSPLVVS